MPVKFAYGPTKDLETYIIVPFIHNWAVKIWILPAPMAKPPPVTAASGISRHGQIQSAAGRRLPAGRQRRGGVGRIPTGHASRLNPAKLGQDAIGTGALTFTTGVNLYKWLKPFLVYSKIWMNTPINIYQWRPDPTRNVRSREYVTFNLAAEFPLRKVCGPVGNVQQLDLA